MENTLPLGVDWRAKPCTHCLTCMGHTTFDTLHDPIVPPSFRRPWAGVAGAVLVSLWLTWVYIVPAHWKTAAPVAIDPPPFSAQPSSLTQPPPPQPPSAVVSRPSRMHAPISPQENASKPFLSPPNAQTSEAQETDIFNNKTPRFVETDPIATIQTLYADMDTRDDAQETARMRHTIQKHVRKHAARLAKKKAWRELLDFFVFLQGMAPDHPPYAMDMAKVHLALGEFERAMLAVSPYRHDPVWAEKAARIVRTATRRQARLNPEDTEIALISHGSGFLVDARLNDAMDVRLMLDTGATLTVLHRAFLEETGLQVTPTDQEQTLHTANGPVQAPLVTLEMLALKDRRKPNITVAILENTPFEGFDGLLGMDFLGAYRFFIEPDKKTMTLSDK